MKAIPILICLTCFASVQADDELLALKVEAAVLKARMQRLEALYGADEQDQPLRDEDINDDLRSAIDSQFPGALSGPELPAEAQPTPWPEVGRAINLLKPGRDEMFVDFGAGADARVCIEAAKYYGCRSIGVEVDPQRAALAERHVMDAGLSGSVRIVEGDATTVDVDADVGFAYLYPEVLESLKPKIEKLDRFVSYMHKVPGLEMKKHGNLWYWERSVKPEITYAERPYAIYGGRKYYAANNGCGCSMCRNIRSQIASRQHVEKVPVKSTPAPTQMSRHTSPPVSVRSSNCASGNCSRGNCANGRCNRGLFRGLFR